MYVYVDVYAIWIYCTYREMIIVHILHEMLNEASAAIIASDQMVLRFMKGHLFLLRHILLYI